MFLATEPANVVAPMLPSRAKLLIRALVDSMKSVKVERVSNADRARYALRASPNAHRQKDQTFTISLQKRSTQPRVGQIRISQRPPSISLNGMNLLTGPRPAKIIVAIGKNA